MQLGNISIQSAVDEARARASGISIMDGGKVVEFPLGPKLLVSLADSSTGMLEWVFESSGNTSWAVGAIPKSKIDR